MLPSSLCVLEKNDLEGWTDAQCTSLSSAFNIQSKHTDSQLEGLREGPAVLLSATKGEDIFF